MWKFRSEKYIKDTEMPFNDNYTIDIIDKSKAHDTL
jgi:hypothetical protein